MKTLILAAIFGMTAFTAIAPAHADVMSVATRAKMALMWHRMYAAAQMEL